MRVAAAYNPGRPGALVTPERDEGGTPPGIGGQRSARRTGPLYALLLTLLAVTALAAPLEVREPGFNLTLPDGFREVSDASHSTEVTRLFVLKDEPAQTSLTVSRISSNDTPALWPEATNEMKIVGRYSERLNDLDVEVLISQSGTNDSATLERSARLPLTPSAIRLDLKSRAENDAEAQALMRKILQSVATAQPEPEPQEPVNWRGTLICLAMAALMFVVVMARR